MNKLKWFLLGILIIVLTFVAIEMSSSEELTAHYDITLYTMSTDQQLTVAWDDSNPDFEDFFEFYLWNHGEQSQYAIGETQQLQVTTFIPRTGLYVFFCRSCDKPKNDSTRLCSEYTSSVMVNAEGTPNSLVRDPATGQLTPGKWMVYGHVGAPTDGGVNITP